MVARRTFLRMAGGSAGALFLGTPTQARDGDPIQRIQAEIENHHRMARNRHRANIGVVVGVVTPDNAASNGRILYADQGTLTNPFGKRLELNGHTPFEIGSTSKVFTSGIHYMLHGPYDGTLGAWLGDRMTMSRAVAEISLKNLAIYQPGLAQDNHGGVYPPRMMASLTNLFAYMKTFAPPFRQGACYAYSNIGWALLSMAAVKLGSTDTQEFVRTYNESLVKFCNGFSATNTQVFRFDLKPRLPMGYTDSFAPLPSRRNYQPSHEAGYGSGGIVSNGADMMQFLAGFETPGEKVVVLNKNGGVAGFTSWMGFTSWQGTGAPSSYGVFVLSNGPGSTRIGNNAMRLLLRG
jgi:CubicO group peptidase (beta-lactamase class C family)